jgi:hypothetical protein
MQNKSEDFNLKSLSIRRIEMQVLKAIISKAKSRGRIEFDFVFENSWHWRNLRISFESNN